MELIAACANSFIELFKVGAHIFTGFVTGIIPLVIVLMTIAHLVIGLSMKKNLVVPLIALSRKFMIEDYSLAFGLNQKWYQLTANFIELILIGSFRQISESILILAINWS